MIDTRLFARVFSGVLGLGLLLNACQTPPVNESAIPDPEAQVVEIPQEAELGEVVELEPWELEFRRQRIIGDILYDGLRALNQDRLLSPSGNNAYAYYQQVLALDPGNELAAEGLKNIVNRYLELAAIASRQGRFAAADDLLSRARFVDAQDPAIQRAQAALNADRNSGDLIFTLDGDALAARSPALVTQLGEIARQAVTSNASVWITAPNDEQGRWIYNTLREQANGARLRGNIEIGGFAIVRLRKTASNSGEGIGAAPGLSNRDTP